MDPTDPTRELLLGIRDYVKTVRDDMNIVWDNVRSLRDEVRNTDVRLDWIDRRQTESGMRVATELVARCGRPAGSARRRD
jgi:hypothetical protein